MEASAERWQQLQFWSQQPLGQSFHTREGHLLQEMLTSLFGYYLVALGGPLDRALLNMSPVSRRWIMQVYESKNYAFNLSGVPEQLPLATDSVDVLVLSHVLECCIDPVAALKEVDRVLIAEGHAIILGFNPLSLWRGYLALPPRNTGHNPYRDLDACSVSQLRSWLALLGLETLAVHYHSHGFPTKRWTQIQTWAERHWRYAGAGYVLLARKRVSTLTPMRPRWVVRPMVSQGVAPLQRSEAIPPIVVTTEQESNPL